MVKGLTHNMSLLVSLSSNQLIRMPQKVLLYEHSEGILNI